MEIFLEFTFACAHFLPKMPADHPCRKLHGHNYRAVLRVEGEVDPELGWVMDFAELKARADRVRDRLDHSFLNEVEGLQNPTCENLSIYIWNNLAPDLPGLASVEVGENNAAGCVFRGPARE
jgi:6-pyruvoyltetrahydropterin/6-carboxytetrahydropterin synthase